MARKLDPALRARLEQIERYDRRVAARQREDTARKVIPKEHWRDIIIAKCAPPPRAPAKRMHGKTWLFGDKDEGVEAGLTRFPQLDKESLKAWTRRLSDAADRERVSGSSPGYFENLIHEQKRPPKP